MSISQPSPPSFLVRKHVVPVPDDPASTFGQWATEQRLSPMQRALLASGSGTVRVVDAPTGSGKSFAFQKAVLRSDAIKTPGNVLFIAPTRRLSEALANDLRQRLAQELQAQDPALSGAEALMNEKVLVWNGGQVITQASARTQRLDELNRATAHPEVRTTVFTVMEILEKMMFPIRLKAGTIDEHSFQFLGHFQHIVFDEFHTLDKGAMALATLVATLVSRWRMKGRKEFLHENIPTVTFLSATPINVEKLLEAAGMLPFDPCTNPDGYHRIREVVVDRNAPQPRLARVLHGDVRITFEEQASPLAMMSDHLDLVRTDLAANRQVVVIYNELSALKRDTRSDGFSPSRLDDVLNHLSLSPDDVLVINSADDRTIFLDGQGKNVPPMAQVAQKDTHRFRLLLATSSVEAGVTFKDNRLLFMDPGMNPLSFMQRVGRTARGDLAGQVFVRYDQGLLDKLRHTARLTGGPEGEWLTTLIEAARSLSERTDGISIEEFQTMMKNLAVRGSWTFGQDVDRPADPDHYRSIREGMVMHMRLYWAMQMFVFLRKFQKNPPQLLLDLVAMEPCEVTQLRRSMKAVDQALQGLPLSVRFNGGALKTWWEALQVAILDLRQIGMTMDLEDVDAAGQRRRRPFSLVHLMNKTSVMDHARLAQREEGYVLVCDGNADSFYTPPEASSGASVREWGVRPVLDPMTGGEYLLARTSKSVRDVVVSVRDRLIDVGEKSRNTTVCREIGMLRHWMETANLIVWVPWPDMTSIIAGCLHDVVL